MAAMPGASARPGPARPDPTCRAGEWSETCGGPSAEDSRCSRSRAARGEAAVGPASCAVGPDRASRRARPSPPPTVHDPGPADGAVQGRPPERQRRRQSERGQYFGHHGQRPRQRRWHTGNSQGKTVCFRPEMSRVRGCHCGCRASLWVSREDVVLRRCSPEDTVTHPAACFHRTD